MYVNETNVNTTKFMLQILYSLSSFAVFFLLIDIPKFRDQGICFIPKIKM